MGRSRSRSRDRDNRSKRLRSRSRSRSRDRDNRSNNRSNNRNNNNTNSRNNNNTNSRSINNNNNNSNNSNSNNNTNSRNNNDNTNSRKNDDNTKPDNDNKVVKALVTDTDGEISCSIEETNRIRALLGLRPLNNDKPKERQAVDNFNAKREDEEKLKEAEKLKEQINKAKNKRLLNEKLQGHTLGEADKDNNDEAFLSAADWVKQSRKKELTDKEKADILEKRLLEEEDEYQNSYSSKDLKGIQVKHSMKDFEMGESVILTLADTNILDDNDNLNDEGPVLENVNMTDAERRKEREKRVKRSKLPAYVAYDDEEFDEPGKKRSILSQYDEDKKSAPKLVLGDQGVAMEINKKSGNINFDDDDDITLGIKPVPQSLKVEMQEAKDFYTSTEYAQFQKPKKKKRRTRQKKDDEDEGGLASLESTLLQSANDNDNNQDRGSRSQTAGNQQDDSEIEAKKRYQQALDKSNQNNRLLNKEKVIEIEDDDAEMALSLARARRIAQLEQKKKEDTERVTSNESKVDEDIDDLGASRVMKLMKENKSNIMMKDDKVEEDVDTEGRTTDGKLVFTKTTEFTARLQARLNEDARLRAETAIQKATTSSLNKKYSVSDEDNMDIEGAAIVEQDDDDWEGMDTVNDNNQNDDDDDDNDNDTDDQLGLFHDQPLVSKGMAATLNLLKGTGELKRQQTAVGRANDEREGQGSQYENGVQLEYRDDKGRLLTKKEAFRQVCYDFHGYGAGKNKRDKRIKAAQLEAKTASSRSGPAGTMLALNQVQKATGKAFLKLN